MRIVHLLEPLAKLGQFCRGSLVYNMIKELAMKRKGLFFAVGLLVLVVFAVNAQQGGYRGPNVEVTSVEDAKKLRDDSPVLLRGHIERYLGNEKYLFSDSTGIITIEIEHSVWGTLSVDENDLLEISGEIDRDFRGVEVEVDSIKKI